MSFMPRRAGAASLQPEPQLQRVKFYTNNRTPQNNKRPGGAEFASVTVNLISHAGDGSERMESSNEEGDEAEADDVNNEDQEMSKDDAIEEESGQDLDEESSFISGSSRVHCESAALPNISIPCTKCHELINVCWLQCHRNLHSALRTLQFEQRPTTVKVLVKRRRKIVTRMQQSSADIGEGAFGDKQLHKLNTAFEILKHDIEGSTEQLRVFDDCVDARVEGVGFHLSCTRGVGMCVEANEQWKHMEDTNTYQDHYLANTKSCFLAIYDGYCGTNTARQCAKHLHVYLREELKDVLSHRAAVDVQKRHVALAFRRAYFNVEQLLLLKSDKERLHSRWSGCSAVTCVLTPDTCYLANVGDVGAILIRSNDTVKVLTRKHDLYDKKERARVRQLNGTIVKSEKCALINGALGVTRGIGNLGDGDLKNCIINDPRVRCVRLDPSDQLLVMASSGFWKVFDYEELAYLVGGFMSQVKEEAKRQQLLEKRLPKVHDNERNSYQENDDAAIIQLPITRNRSYPRMSRLKNGCYGDSDVTRSFGGNSPPENGDDAAIIQPPITRNRSYPCMSRQNNGCYGDSDVTRSFGGNSPPDDDQELGRAGGIEAVPLSMEEKARLLAKALAERLVKSALLAGSMDNITVFTVLLPGFSLVPWHTVTSRTLSNLDQPVRVT